MACNFPTHNNEPNQTPVQGHPASDPSEPDATLSPGPRLLSSSCSPSSEASNPSFSGRRHGSIYGNGHRSVSMFAYDDSDSELSELSATPEAFRDLLDSPDLEDGDEYAPTLCSCESWCTCESKHVGYSPIYLSNPILDTQTDNAPVSVIRSTLDEPGAVSDMENTEQMRRTKLYREVLAALRRMQAASTSEHKENAFGNIAETLAGQILHAAPTSSTVGPRLTQGGTRILEFLRSCDVGNINNGDEGEDHGIGDDENEFRSVGTVASGGQPSDEVWNFIATAVAGHPDILMQLRALLPAEDLGILGVSRLTESGSRREMVAQLPFQKDAREALETVAQ